MAVRRAIVKQLSLEHPGTSRDGKNTPGIHELKIKQDQKLWESDQLMEMFFSHSIEGIWFMEADEPFRWDDTVDKEKTLDYAFTHQHIVRVNEAMLNQYNANIEQFIGLTLNDFFAHDIENARKMWWKIFDAGQLTCETMERKFKGYKIFAGEPVWFLGDYFCIYNSEGQMVGHFGAQRDITDSVAATQALKESEERYRFIAKHVADGIILIQQNRILLVNNALLALFGYNSEQDLIGRDIFTLLADETKDQFRDFIKNKHMLMSDTLAGNKPRGEIFQGIYLTRDNRKFWAEGQFAHVKWNGNTAMLGTIRDINERKLREIAVEEHAEDLYRENIKLRSSIKERYRFGNIVGKSRSMQNIYEMIIRVASADANIVIYGESGTGKELVAHAIHKMSHRSDKPFVPVNCNAIPEALLESEFFGYRKGAFTGATRDNPGFLEIADGGDLFLDEIGDLELNMQLKLLRAIEKGGYTPVGSNEVCHSNFRIIAATNKNMADEVRKGRIREDFFYRIHIIPIFLPPLRERKDDIPLLIDHFLASRGIEYSAQQIPASILGAMYNYDWPGNIRELQNALQRYITMGKLDFMHNFKKIPGNLPLPSYSAIEEMGPFYNYQETVETFERNLITQSLKNNNWNRKKVTEALGIPRRTLYNKMRKFGLC